MRGLWGRFLLGSLIVSLSGMAAGAEFVYATVEGQAARFSDPGAPMSFEVKKDQKLEVVVRKEGQVRVRQSPGPKFGWLPEASVTATVPAGVVPSAAPDAGLQLPEGIDLQKLLQQQGLGGPDQ